MKLNYIEIMINIVLASFGGLVKKLSELEKNEFQKVTFSCYMIGSVISMFVGIVVYFLCKNFNASQFLTAGLTALSGYMGSPALDLISNVIKKRILKDTGGNKGNSE